MDKYSANSNDTDRRFQEFKQEELLEEFSITELEDRLEFESWCDSNCKCP